MNHPEVVVRSWRRAMKAPAPPHRIVRSEKPTTRSDKAKGYARGIFWSSDYIKRAAGAMRESRSADWYVLARAALEGAIRDRDDLVALLEDDPPKPPARQAVPAAIAA